MKYPGATIVYDLRASHAVQSDRVFRCRGTQVHVALCRRQVRMASQLLDGPRRCALHRQMRTERVPQDVHALLDPRDALSAADSFDHAVACDRGSVRQAQHALASEVSRGLERRRQPLSQRDLS